MCGLKILFKNHGVSSQLLSTIDYCYYPDDEVEFTCSKGGGGPTCRRGREDLPVVGVGRTYLLDEGRTHWL